MFEWVAMTGCFCPTCKEYIFYKMRGELTAIFDNVGPPWFRHICNNQKAWQKDLFPMDPIESNPIHSIYYNNRGMWRFERRSYEEAISDFNTAIRLNPNAVFYNNRGRAKVALSRQYRDAYIRFQELEMPDTVWSLNADNYTAKIDAAVISALSDYNTAVRINPNYTEAYNNRGVVRADIGEHVSAISDYDIAIWLDPTDAIAYYNRGCAKKKLVPTDNDVKGHLFRKIFGFEYEYDSILREVDNNNNSRRAAYEAVIVDFDAVIRLKPDFVDVYLKRGEAKEKLFQYADAVSDYDIVLRLNPSCFYTYCNRGHVKIRLRKYASAILDFDAAIHLNPAYAIASYLRGNANELWGRTLEAKQDWQTALKQVTNLEFKNKIEQRLCNLKKSIQRQRRRT